MVYTALPDRRIPYDNDGTVVCWWSSAAGVTAYPSGANVLSINGSTYSYISPSPAISGQCGLLFFLPEQREITGVYSWQGGGGTYGDQEQAIGGIQGSNNSGNGQDGTWETASLPGGVPGRVNNYAWRSDIKAVSFTGAKKQVRIYVAGTAFGSLNGWLLCHWYGEKASGQTPDDIIYIDHDTTPGVEFTAPEDFGDQPVGTTVVREFRVKNTSASKTANTINIQCNDSDFAISEDGVVWVVTINIASLSAGAESSTMYVRCTTPAPGNLLGPRFARIVTTVASYT